MIALLSPHSAVAPAQELSRENPTGGVLAGVVRRDDASAAPIIAAEVAIRASVCVPQLALGTFVLPDIPAGDHIVERVL